MSPSAPSCSVVVIRAPRSTSRFTFSHFLFHSLRSTSAPLSPARCFSLVFRFFAIKRCAVQAIGDADTGAKRVAGGATAASFPLLVPPSAPPVSVELRCGLIPLPASPEEQHQSEERYISPKEAYRAEAISRQAAAVSHPSCPQPHLLLPPSESSATFYAVVQHLPHSTLVLSDFTVTSIADGEMLCRSAFISDQRLFDEWVAAELPVGTLLCVVGVAAGFSQQSQEGTFDAVRIELELTLTEADRAIPSLATAPPPEPNAVVLSTAAPPRTAQVADNSVLLTTSFRLQAVCPSLYQLASLPLTTAAP